jgi:putative phosphoesterase
MLIGVVSDTHGHTGNARQAARMLESLAVEQVLHCGDIGSLAIVELVAAWPTHYVLGNVDDDPDDFSEAIRAAGGTFHGRFGSLELGGTRIALLHGDDTRLLRQTIAEGRHDLVCHGHTHVAAERREGPTLVLNPGALYRANPHSLAVVELPAIEVTSVRL